ncbi:heme-binding domain-containing protein [Winogradskyella litoriviva]|uniref:Heme-binding domain-containing protein n=1 Tax=Winogradskyella litoriviva TaxID=1220182 RepID=A0ABX2E6G3_9FLAO|nr:heme-binding domain-containing protein [Winogradskyella litoriviva]NRD24035.1 heme-binding domain-containing protein [Winogradskyella litoriviva]
MKIIKKIALLLLVVFIIAQFFGPDKNEGDIASVEAFYTDTNPPEEVKIILENACNDCHSDNTRYPWYNNITPVNYWLADHVKHGKKHFNISKWNDYSDKKKDHKLDELIEMVEEKEMPLDSYTWTHGEAELSQDQIDAVIAWAKNVRLKYAFLEEAQ